jgi:branched-chain amino acid transport system permease protein
MEYIAHLITLLSVYVILTYALNLIAGEAGLLTFGLGSIWGIGAYAAALAGIRASHLPFLSDLSLIGSFGFGTAMIIAAAAGAVAGIVTAILVLRFRGDVFVLATLAVQALFIGALENLSSITRGTLGLYGLPPPTLFGVTLDAGPPFAGLAAIVAVLVVLVFLTLRGSAFGLSLRALRDNERSAASLAIPPNLRFAVAFAIAGSAAGVAGALYSSEISYIDPNSFSVSDSILVVSMLLVGGRGTVWGPLVGAVIFVSIPELLRYVSWNGSDVAGWRNIIFGVLLVVLVFLRPQGLLGVRQP